MTRYLTALLVILAATGVEAQTFEPALKAALGKMSFEEICRQPELKACRYDILSVIQAFKKVSPEAKDNHSHSNIDHFALQNSLFWLAKVPISACKKAYFAKRWQSVDCKAIHIRAPNMAA